MPGFAQRHRKCDIYQFIGTDSLNMQLVCTQFFNERDKVIKEVSNDYSEAMDASGGTRINIKDDGTYYYYYKDTFLVESRHIFPSRSDSDVYYYFYNEQRQLVAETIKLRKDSILDLEYNEWRVRIFGGDTTTYSYHGNKRKTAVDGHYKSQHFEYDELGRLSKDSTYYFGTYPKSLVANYHYHNDSIKMEFFNSDCNCVFTVHDYLLDNKGLVKEETTHFLEEEEYLKNPSAPAKYRFSQRISYSYYDTGEKKAVRYYYKDGLTMTHLFKYY